jgi:hypothetical protein
VGEAQEVAVAPAVPLAVLDGLVSDALDGLVVVPARDGRAEAAAPLAEPLHVAAKWKRSVPVRHTRGTAARAALRVSGFTSPAARASAKMAVSFLGARPASLIETMRATVRRPSSARHSSDGLALSRVRTRSEA